MKSAYAWKFVLILIETLTPSLSFLTPHDTLPQNTQPELFPGLSKIPQAKRNCRLGCQTDLTDTSHDSKSGSSPPCGVAAPSRPSSHSTQAKENSAAETRPPRAPARLPALRTPTRRPLCSAPARPRHRTPPRSQRAPPVLRGHPGSSPHKERRLSIRVNLAGPRANTIGRVFTNEISLRLW